MIPVSIFVLTFFCLRYYLGGIHFNNSILCLLISITNALIIPWISIVFVDFTCISLITIHLICIFLTSHIKTIDHPNKPLTKQEKNALTNKGIFVELCFFVLSLFAYLLGVKYLYIEITCALITCNCELLVSKIKKISKI